jgi:hypothetical protein
VRIDSSTICGTDLHILKGDVPEVTSGTVLGHEDLLLRVSRLADDLPELAELELNPVAGPEGCVIVDARVRVAPPPRTSALKTW